MHTWGMGLSDSIPVEAVRSLLAQRGITVPEDPTVVEMIEEQYGVQPAPAMTVYKGIPTIAAALQTQPITQYRPGVAPAPYQEQQPAEGGIPRWVWIAGGVALLAVVGGAVYWIVR